MKSLNRDELIQDFWKGETTTEEEKFLRENWNMEQMEPSDQEYFRFLYSQTDVPSDLEEDIWNRMQVKKSFIHSGIFRWAVAASIAFILTFGGYLGQQYRSTKLNEQFALLENTMQYVSQQVTPEPQQEVLYEDDIIVIIANN